MVRVTCVECTVVPLVAVMVIMLVVVGMPKPLFAPQPVMIAALAAGPPSPEKAKAPVPAMVVMMPF